MSSQLPFFEKVYRVARKIPAGRVTSYGRIAQMLDAPRGARAVGYAMRGLKFKRNDPNFQDVPWHRVVNSQGRISLGGSSKFRQADLLLDEGVAVDQDFAVDLDKYLWQGLLPHEIKDLLEEPYDQ